MENLMSFLWSSVFVLIVVLLIIISWVLSFKWRVNKDVLTMLGILGTFCWIISWLYSYDSTDSNTIPYLINWLKTAFFTSVAWLFGSIVLIYLDKKDDNKWTNDILLEISNKLSELVDNKNNSQNAVLDIKNELINLNKNIWWDGESSLLTQIQKLRTTFSDKQDEIKSNIIEWNEKIVESSNNNHEKFQKSFDDFATKMADQNINALTEAIEKVMWEFNTTINEKLWKVFEDFKDAVNNLNVWQWEYKDQIINNTEALNKANESLDKSCKSFEITSEKAESFIWISESLWNQIKILNDSLEIFKKWINEFDWVANNTKESWDKIIESIDSLKENFIWKAEIMISESESHIKNMKESFENQSKDLVESHSNILNDLKNNVDNTNKNVSEQFERIASELERQVVTLDDNLREHYEDFNQQLQTELWNSLKEFDRAIVTVYKNFIEELNSLSNNK